MTVHIFLRTPTDQKHGRYLSSEVLEIFSCGDPAHLAVRLPVRIQALDNELRHLQTEEKRGDKLLNCTDEKRQQKAQPAIPVSSLSCWSRTTILGSQ